MNGRPMLQSGEADRSEANSIEAVASALEAEFAGLEDWSQRINHLLALGRSLDGIAPRDRQSSDRLNGCQSQVWLAIDADEGVLTLRADSDALIMRGLLSVALRLYSGRRAEEILSHPADVLQSLAVGRNLAPSRSNGLHLIETRIRDAATAASRRVAVRHVEG